MNWKHVQLIFKREMVDQLRDRRTLFTITILPLLLYPLLGMMMMQVAQFNQEHPVRVRVIGAEHFPTDLPLVNQRGEIVLANAPINAKRLLEFEVTPWPSDLSEFDREELVQSAKAALAADRIDAVLLVDPSFTDQLEARLNFQASVGNPSESVVESDVKEASRIDPEASEPKADFTSAQEMDPPRPPQGLQLIANLARDQSQIAQTRLSILVDRWWDSWRATQLESAGLPAALSDPIQLTQVDTSPSSVRRAVRWSKVLPFIMLIWALTGAFYPAIDLCAGEKERGTLETLLSSPARRREIVWGKLLTINVFSIGSALLNLMSMHFTAGLIVKRLAGSGTPDIAQALGPMPLHALGWLVLLLLPMAAFFSALALAVAALAKSTKEGQYYLMPLLLVTLPLVGLPMIPSMEMNLGTSLIPVSGAVFLVRSLIEGRYTEAIVHLPVVLLVTITCCSLATRWAIRQFESETVMFHESGRWNLRTWMHHLWRDRQDTASPTEALLCGVMILIAMFFAQFVAGSANNTWAGIVQSTVVVQIGLVLTPCLLMAIFLTRSIRRALRIHRTQPSHVAAAICIGFALHPTYRVLGEAISKVYKISPEVTEVLQHFQAMVLQQPLWAILLVLAVLPAVCEELTFRGFIFGGLLRQSGVVRAVIVSSLFFGFTHTLLQQSIAATTMGLLLGIIAWRTGGVICTIIVHMINNTLTLTLAWCGAHAMQVPSGLEWAIQSGSDGWVYQPQWITISVMLSIALFFVLFHRSRDTQQVVLAEMA